MSRVIRWFLCLVVGVVVSTWLHAPAHAFGPAGTSSQKCIPRGTPTQWICGDSVVSAGYAAMDYDKAGFLAACTSPGQSCAITGTLCESSDNYSVTCNARGTITTCTSSGCSTTQNNYLGSLSTVPYDRTQCWPNSTDTGAGCKCNVGFKAGPNNSCDPYTCEKGGMSGRTGYGPYPGSGLAMADKIVCISGAGGGANGGCRHKTTPDTAKCNGGDCWGVGPGGLTGEYCDSPPPAAPPAGSGADPTEDKGTTDNPPPEPCPAKQCPGTVNGVSVCVPCSVTEAPKKETSDTPDPDAPPGAKSKETGTECSGGSCTTTTTWKDAAGNIVGTKKETSKEGTFCSENPSSPLCKESAINGSCAAVSCTGDAVQCAIAKEQAKRNCEFYAANPLSNVGGTAAGGSSVPGDHPRSSGTERDMGGMISTVDQFSLPGGGGIADMSFDLNGRQLVIPFSKLNDPLTTLGHLFVGLTLITALFVVFK